MEKISKNCYKGELITNPMDILRLAKEKKSIYSQNCWGLCPAAIFLNYPLILIITAINNGNLFYVHNSEKS